MRHGGRDRCIGRKRRGDSQRHGPDYAEKWAAERAAQRVEGVKAIAIEIQIKPVGIHAKSDTEIAAIAASSLNSHVWVPTDIQATVRKGWVTLKGVVNWDSSRERRPTPSVFWPA